MEIEVVPILRVANADVAVRWYERLGFTKQWEHRFDPGCPAFVSIARGGVRLFLSEHRGDARPDTLVGLMVSDVDAVEAEFGRQSRAGQERGADGDQAGRRVPRDGSRSNRGPRCLAGTPWLPVVLSIALVCLFLAGFFLVRGTHCGNPNGCDGGGG